MKRLVLGFVFSIVLLSCQDEDVPTHALESAIIVEVKESLSAEGRTLTLDCKTEKIYPCKNYQLVATSAFEDNTHILYFNGVEAPSICLTALGPAGYVFTIEPDDNDQYALSFINGMLNDKGSLTINDSRIDIQLESQHVVQLVRETTMRVPPNTYWGTIGYHTASSASQAEEFLQEMEEGGITFSEQTTGHYYYYEIDDNGEMIVDAASSGYHFVKGVIFQFDGDESVVYNLVNQAGSKYYPDLYINIQNDKGERINNWQQ